MLTPTIKPLKKKILLIDNDPASTRMVRLTLERQPAFEVRELNNPLEAVRAAHDFGPDLVLLDVEMPEMDGGEGARRRHADPRLSRLPIIFMTSLVTDEETENNPLYTNGLRVLAKPVTMSSSCGAWPNVWMSSAPTHATSQPHP